MIAVDHSVEEYLNHCTYEKNLNRLSTKAYKIDLEQFSSFFGPRRSVAEITKEDIRLFVRKLFELHLKETSIKRKVASLKAYLRYLEHEDHIAVSPFRKLDIHIRIPKRIPKYLSMQEVRQLFSAVRSDLRHDRKKSRAASSSFQPTDWNRYVSLQRVVVLELLFSTGMRVSELCHLNLNDLDLSKMMISVFGKGSKERSILVTNPQLITILGRFKDQRDKVRTRSEALLVNRFGKRMQPHSIRLILREMSSKAELAYRVKPHMFRHTIATMLIENGMDTRFVQKFLGHSSIMTTQIYTHPSTNAERQLLLDKHPRNFL